MKNVKSLLALPVAALLLAGCSSDEPAAPQGVDTTGDAPMGFAMYTGNLSRASNLEDTYPNFGVWAYKGADVAGFTTATNTNTVMDHYLVGYNGTGCYTAPDGAYTTGSSWVYDLMGNTQYTGSMTKSTNEKQYLKYWDTSMALTNFYAYSPYTNPQKVTFDASNQTMTFPEIVQSTEAGSVYMFGATTTVPSTACTGTVPLVFTRLQSRLQIAFWTDYTGYNIQLVDVTVGGVNKGVFAIPANYDADATPKYTKGTYAWKAAPSVVFSMPDPATSGAAMTSAVTYTTPVTTDAPCLSFGLPTNNLPTTRAEALADCMSTTTYYTLPAGAISAVTNSGFVFYISYRMTAKDTGETILVKNAAVYVAPAYTAWAANTAYTYVFKITSAAGPGPDPDPDAPDVPDSEMHPIVFDGMTVSDYNTSGWEWVVGGDGTPESF